MPYDADTLVSGPMTGIPETEFAMDAPNGGVTALTAVSSINAGTAFLVTFPSSPPICEPAQSPVPLNTPSRLILAINFWLLRLAVFLRLTMFNL